MKVEKLEIENFRNIREMLFDPVEGPNIIYGDNAQGKTNLLEAVWLFSGSRSFRGSKDADYIPFGGGASRLDLAFRADGRSQTASIRYSRREEKEKRSQSLNEVKQNRIGNFAGVFCTVVFSPDHLSLIKEGPEKRRKMIDASLSQAFPKYGKILESYEKNLRQRSRLLKDIPLHPSLMDTLDVWDAGLLEYGAYITQMRARYVARLSALTKEIYAGISYGKESFSAAYAPSFGEDVAGFQREDFRRCLERSLHANRAEDIKNGSTSVGPHRDDIDIRIDGASARSFGSQGQQRSCILALKLAECRILEDRFGEPPVILLDDVMSELDEHRRSYLLNQLGGRQILITCCDTSAFESMKEGKIFHIHGGELLPGEKLSTNKPPKPPLL